MGKKNHSCSPYIDVQMQDKGVAFAGMQYQIDNCNKVEKKHSSKYNIFREGILKLLYSNFKIYEMEEREAKFIIDSMIHTGMVCAVKSTFNIEEQTPDAIVFGRYGAHPYISDVDFYGYPLACSCTGINGKSVNASKQQDFVIGFDNNANYRAATYTAPIITYVDRLALELDDAYSAWKVAAETHKIGMVCQVSDEKSEKILKEIMKGISENDPFIVVRGSVSQKVETLFAPNNYTALEAYHQNFINSWGFVLDMIGVENSNNNKRERQVVAEVEMNRSLSRCFAADRLKAWTEFLDECNKKFGTRYRVENYLESIVKESEVEANNEGIEESENMGGNENV